MKATTPCVETASSSITGSALSSLSCNTSMSVQLPLQTQMVVGENSNHNEHIDEEEEMHVQSLQVEPLTTNSRGSVHNNMRMINMNDMNMLKASVEDNLIRLSKRLSANYTSDVLLGVPYSPRRSNSNNLSYFFSSSCSL